MPEALYDHVIVGGGTAGCLLANRLSADPRRRVLLLEAGPADNYHWIHIPVGYLYCIGNPRTDWLYQTDADAGLNGRQLRYPRGRTLGGCSSINGMIYMRGQSRDYDGWAAATGSDAWAWRNTLPYFLLHEDHHGGADALHGAAGTMPAVLRGQAQGARDDAYLQSLRARGAGGEWRVERQRLRWDILDAFARAAEQAGIAPTPDFNRGSNEGVGYFEVNQRAGWRWNTAKAFLRPAKERPNLSIQVGAQVQRLVLQADGDGTMRCTGLRFWNGRESVTVKARHEVILSAGSIGTPQILQLSGIGPGAWLAQHGVNVLHALPGVGENLQDHLQIRAVFKVQKVSTLNVLANSLLGKARIGLEYAVNRSGPMSMAPSQLGAFARSDPQREWPNLQYHVQPLSLDAFGEPLHGFPAFTASVCNLNPTSRGRVRIRGPRFDEAPSIAPNYLSTEEDRQVAAQSLRLTRRIVAQPAMAPYQPQEWKPGTQYQTDDELARLAGDIATTIFHPVGTTRMGRDDDPMAVVDARLRVRGVRGLRVVDAGVMPTITSGNTNSPTLMIAERAAQWIAEEAVRHETLTT
ncbi:GMC family oxidoreductase [Aquincola tertiaricarbonis]|uniref:GMC family oxidoreductase n=1 Tax=Aquincola tertiaricarbonis TaxID=391953 RepID=UPI000614EA28|nr:GMC family oxidoreductase N-terminal domain-containing protein [Aquincola tertiaricarbonis]